MSAARVDLTVTVETEEAAQEVFGKLSDLFMADERIIDFECYIEEAEQSA